MIISPCCLFFLHPDFTSLLQSQFVHDLSRNSKMQMVNLTSQNVRDFSSNKKSLCLGAARLSFLSQGGVCPSLGKGSTKTMQPLPGLASGCVGKSREFSCSCVFKELQNTLTHLSALWFPQLCEVCICLPESCNYLGESKATEVQRRGKTRTGHLNSSKVSSDPARRSPPKGDNGMKETLLIPMQQTWI